MFNLENLLQITFGKGRLPLTKYTRFYRPDINGFWTVMKSFYDNLVVSSQIINYAKFITYHQFQLYVASYARAIQLSVYYEYYRNADVNLSSFDPSKVRFILQHFIPETVYDAITYLIAPRLLPDANIMIPEFDFTFLPELSYDPKEFVHNLVRLGQPDQRLIKFQIYHFNILCTRITSFEGYTSMLKGVSPITPTVIKAHFRFDYDDQFPKYTSKDVHQRPIITKPSTYTNERRAYNRIIKNFNLDKTDLSDITETQLSTLRKIKHVNDEGYFRPHPERKEQETDVLLHDYDYEERHLIELEGLFQSIIIKLPCDYLDEEEFEEAPLIPQLQFIGKAPFTRQKTVHNSQLLQLFQLFSHNVDTRVALTISQVYNRLQQTVNIDHFNIKIPRISSFTSKPLKSKIKSPLKRNLTGKKGTKRRYVFKDKDKGKPSLKPKVDEPK